MNARVLVVWSYGAFCNSLFFSTLRKCLIFSNRVPFGPIPPRFGHFFEGPGTRPFPAVTPATIGLQAFWTPFWPFLIRRNEYKPNFLTLLTFESPFSLQAPPPLGCRVFWAVFWFFGVIFVHPAEWIFFRPKVIFF